jgi:elongation factor Ts
VTGAIVVISANQVKELRQLTGAGIMDCKRALEETNGDVPRATAFLRQQGLATAEKKSGRTALQGVVEPYIHAGGRIGALVEVNCETDFVARTADFRELAHDLALHIAASSPRVVSEEQLPVSELAAMEKEYGDRGKVLEAVCLLDQPFVKDPKRTVRDLVRDNIAKLGENIVVRRFARFELGADLTSAESDGQNA